MASSRLHLSSASIGLVTLASIIPFSFILFDGSSTNIISSYNQGLSLLSMVFSTPHTINVNPYSILAANLQIHAINSVLLLILSYHFLKTQRCYGHQIRETACLLAVMIFAVHPGRLEYMRRSDLLSVHHQFAICLSLMGVVLSMHFLDSNKRFPFTIVQAILSGVFLSTGAFLGAPISTVAIPLLFYAAVVLQQIRCGLSLFKSAILTVSHGACAALVAHAHTKYCVSTNSSFLLCSNSRDSTGQYYTSSSGTVMSKSFRRHGDALVNITSSLWQEPLRMYFFLEQHAKAGLIEITGLVNQLIKGIDTITISASFRSHLRTETMNNVYHELIQLVIPVFVGFLSIRVVSQCLYDAFRWKTTTNFNFAYIALLVTVFCSPPTATTSLLDMDSLWMSLQSYIPSAFMCVCLGELMVVLSILHSLCSSMCPLPHSSSLSVCCNLHVAYSMCATAVALADAWAAQLLVSKDTAAATGSIPTSQHLSHQNSSSMWATVTMHPKGVLVTTAFRLLTAATFCLGMQSFMRTTARPRSGVTTKSTSSFSISSSPSRTKDRVAATIDLPAVVPIAPIQTSHSLPETEEYEALDNSNIAFTARISREL